MIWWTLLLQIFFQICFWLKDFFKIVRLLLAATSIKGLIKIWHGVGSEAMRGGGGGGEGGSEAKTSVQ